MKMKKLLFLAALGLMATATFTSCEDILGHWERPTGAVNSYLTLDKSAVTLPPGATAKLTSNTISDGSQTWSTSDASIVTVDNAGNITAVKSGDATITVKVASTANYNADNASCAVKVRVQDFDQMKAELENGTGEVKVYLDAAANIEMGEDLDITGKKVSIIGDKANPAAMVVTKQFTFDNDFTIQNVILDFTNQTNDFLKFTGEAEEVTKIEGVVIDNVQAIGMKNCLFNMNGKTNYLMNNFTINNSIIEMAANQPIVNFKSSGCAYNINFLNSTIYTLLPQGSAQSALPFTSQAGKRIIDLDANGIQTFNLINSTFFNLSKSANFFTHRQTSQTWLVYNVQNNIFVDCGKDGQTVVGINGGVVSTNPTWNVSGNVFNFNGVDKSEAEVAKAGNDANGNAIVQNSIAVVVNFKDVNMADFTQSDAAAGDPRWIK